MVSVEGLQKRQMMLKRVKEEVKHIPRGDSPQNLLRYVYNMLRLHTLGRKATREFSKEEVLAESIAAVGQQYPHFTPKFDLNFFDSKKLLLACDVLDPEKRKICRVLIERALKKKGK